MKINKTKMATCMLRRGFSTQKELAKKSGLNENTVSNLMRGLPGKLETVGRLAKALGIDPVEILED